MNNVLIHPYISSFQCITQENTTFTSAPCVTFTQNETQPAIRNWKASNYSQNFKIQHEGLVSKIGINMDYKANPSI